MAWSGARVALSLGLVAVVASSCGGSSPAVAPSATEAPPAAAAPCVVRLHGKGEKGAPTTTRADGVRVASPPGNAEGWKGLQWRYDTDAAYAAAVAIVAADVTAQRCDAVVLHGFSNGGAFAAKVYCRGESFGGLLRGVVVDDPVPDAGVRPCAPAAGVKVALYWTGALTEAVAGWSCAEKDWTCEGGTTIGIDAYAAALGTPVQRSAETTHRRNDAATELSAWLA